MQQKHIIHSPVLIIKMTLKTLQISASALYQKVSMFSQQHKCTSLKKEKWTFKKLHSQFKYFTYYDNLIRSTNTTAAKSLGRYNWISNLTVIKCKWKKMPWTRKLHVFELHAAALWKNVFTWNVPWIFIGHWFYSTKFNN